jgi:hypothetical protein
MIGAPAHCANGRIIAANSAGNTVLVYPNTTKKTDGRAKLRSKRERSLIAMKRSEE